MYLGPSRHHIGQATLLAAAIFAIAAPPVGAQTTPEPCYIDSNPCDPGAGVPVAWAESVTNIEVEIYVPPDDSRPDPDTMPSRQQTLAAVKAAFDTYAAVPCSRLTFTYEELSEWKQHVEKAEFPTITVGFAANGGDWTHGGKSAYRLHFETQSFEGGELKWGFIKLNAWELDMGQFSWVIDSESHFDVQGAMTQFIPHVLGYGVGDRSDLLNPDIVSRKLTQAQIDGLQATYYDTADDSCAAEGRPVMDTFCGLPADDPDFTPPDGCYQDGGPSLPRDGGTTPNPGNGDVDAGAQPTGDGGLTSDGGTFIPGSDEGGCCRISGGDAGGLVYAAFLGIALILGAGRRRRSRGNK